MAAILITVGLSSHMVIYRRPAETNTVSMEPVPAIPAMTTYDEIPGAEDKEHDNSGYESLRASGNIYNTLDEAPPPPSTDTRPPPPPTKPSPRTSVDEHGYLRL